MRYYKKFGVLKLFKWLVSFFTIQFFIIFLVTYFLVLNTIDLLNPYKIVSSIPQTMTFELNDTDKLIIQNSEEEENYFSQTCIREEQKMKCTLTALIPAYYVDTPDFQTLNISCQKSCNIEINTTYYKPINVFIYGKNVKLNIEYLKTVNFLMDSVEGSITIRELVFNTAKINLNIGNIAFQTSQNLAVTSITSQKYLCITSFKSYSVDMKTQAIITIDDISDIIQTKDQGDCLKVFPYEQRNHSQMIKEIKHPLFDNLQNTQMMQFEEVRCIYFDNLILMSNNDIPSSANLKQLFISNSQGNIYLNVVDNKKKMGSLLFNDEFQSNSKLNFSEKSAYNIQQTIQKLSNSGRSQDILLLNFQNNYETTTSTFIILFNPITLFATSLTISLFSFGTLSNTQEQQFPDLLPNICPYIFSRESFEKLEYSQTIQEQRKELFNKLIKQYFLETDTSVYAHFDYEVYQKISFPKIQTFPDQDEASKRLTIINISIIPFSFIGILILQKFVSFVLYYLDKVAQQRKEMDKEKIIFALITHYQNNQKENQQNSSIDWIHDQVSKEVGEEKSNSKVIEVQFVSVCSLTLYSIQYLYQTVMNWFRFQQINSFQLFCKILFMKIVSAAKVYPENSKKTNLKDQSVIQVLKDQQDMEKSNIGMEKSSIGRKKTWKQQTNDQENNIITEEDENQTELDLDKFKEYYQLFCYIYNLNEVYIFSEENLSILNYYKFQIKYKKNEKNEIFKVVSSFGKIQCTNSNFQKGPYYYCMNSNFLKQLFNIIQYNYILLKHRKYKDFEVRLPVLKLWNSLKNKYQSMVSFFRRSICCEKKQENSNQQQFNYLTGVELLKLIKKHTNVKFKEYLREKESLINFAINTIIRGITAIAVPIAVYSPTIIFFWIFKGEHAKYIFNLKKIYNDDYSNSDNNYQLQEVFSDCLFYSAIAQGITFISLLFLNGMDSFSSITQNTEYVYFKKITSRCEKILKQIFYLKFYDLLGQISTLLLIFHLLIQVAYVYIGLIMIIVGSIAFTKVELPFLIFITFLITVIGKLSYNFYDNQEKGRKKLYSIFYENYQANVRKYKEMSLQAGQDQDQIIDYKLTVKDELYIQFKLADTTKNQEKNEYEQAKQQQEEEEEVITFEEIEKHFENINMNLNKFQINQLYAKIIDKSSSYFELQLKMGIDFDQFQQFVEEFIKQKVKQALVRIGVSYEVLLRSIFKILSISIFVGFFLYMVFESFITADDNLDLLSSNGIISSGGITSIFLLKEDKSAVLLDEKVLNEAAQEVERIFHYKNNSQQFNCELESIKTKKDKRSQSNELQKNEVLEP